MIYNPLRSKGFTLIELMVVVAIISILTSIAVPQYIKYVKRARTTECLEHVEKMCKASMDWSCHCQLGNGSFAKSTTTKSNIASRIEFKNLYPNVACWWDYGDHFYNYSISTTTDPKGGVIPLVTAEAKNYNAVFASKVKSQRGCGYQIEEVSPLF